MEKCWEYQVDVFQIFVDFRQAYNSIDRHHLYRILSSFGIPAKIVRLIKMTMQESKAQVRIGGDLTDEFPVNNGLKQGDGLAPILFNFALEHIIRQLPVDTNSSLVNKSSQIIGYADDINIVARSRTIAKEIFIKLEDTAKEIGLKINSDKTKAMVMTRSQRRVSQNWTIDEHNVEVVNGFVYLGSYLTNENDETVEIERRINLANKIYFALLPAMKSRVVNQRTKVRLYKTTIRPVLCYGSETWTLTSKMCELLDRFERKILRRIYGGVYENGHWRIRYNNELYSKYNDISLSNYIKLQRLQWAGHVQRMQEQRIPKRVLNGKMEGKRPRGRPRDRWEDEIYRSSELLLQSRNWKTLSQNRDEWRSRIAEARARLGL
jgi:sorting nexin-29